MKRRRNGLAGSIDFVVVQEFTALPDTRPSAE